MLLCPPLTLGRRGLPIAAITRSPKPRQHVRVHHVKVTTQQILHCEPKGSEKCGQAKEKIYQWVYNGSNGPELDGRRRRSLSEAATVLWLLRLTGGLGSLSTAVYLVFIRSLPFVRKWQTSKLDLCLIIPLYLSFRNRRYTVCPIHLYECTSRNMQRGRLRSSPKCH